MGIIEWEDGHTGVAMLISLCECGTAMLTISQADGSCRSTRIQPSVCIALFRAVRSTLALDAMARQSGN